MLRFDSLSKILSAGIRIGFASGPEPLLAAIDKHVSLRGDDGGVDESKEKETANEGAYGVVGGVRILPL